MEKVRTTDVFTPTTPARFAFVERTALNNQLVEALMTPGKQVVVYGSSGSGKTTLLVNKLAQLYPDHITTRCTAATTFETLLLSAFDSLGVYYASTASIKKGKSITTKLEKEYYGIKASIEATSTRETEVSYARLLPPQLTPQRLAEFCGAAGCCWVLEDFHKVPQSEKTKTAQVMKVFMDTAAEYSDVKVVAIGAVDTAREVIQYDPEMRNRVAEIAVPLMSEHELQELLTKGEELLNIRFGALKSVMASYSSGLAGVCHQLGLNICFAAGVQETADQIHQIDSSQLKKAVDRYLSDASDTLKAVFDLALRRQSARSFDNTRLILQSLSSIGAAGGTHAEILKQVRQEESEYPAGNLTVYLAELQSSKRGELLRFDAVSGKYFFSDPLYLAYSQFLLLQPKEAKSVFLSYDLDYGEFAEELTKSIQKYLGEQLRIKP